MEDLTDIMEDNVGKMPSNLFKVEMGSVEGENNNKAMASER
jgi:hypothetical protein